MVIKMSKGTRKVQGWYQPHDRWGDFDNLRLDVKTGELVPRPSMTKQEFARECDINNIIKDFKVTGQIAHINQQARQGAYVDLPDSLDYQQSLELVRSAEASFATLPSKLRDKLGNSPAAFLLWMQDPANQEEIYTLGLATRPASPTPAPAAPAPTGPAEPPKA